MSVILAETTKNINHNTKVLRSLQILPLRAVAFPPYRMSLLRIISAMTQIYELSLWTDLKDF